MKHLIKALTFGEIDVQIKYKNHILSINEGENNNLLNPQNINMPMI